eukprot:gene23010-biopygen23787
MRLLAEKWWGTWKTDVPQVHQIRTISPGTGHMDRPLPASPGSFRFSSVRSHSGSVQLSPDSFRLSPGSVQLSPCSLRLSPAESRHIPAHSGSVQLIPGSFQLPAQSGLSPATV